MVLAPSLHGAGVAKRRFKQWTIDVQLATMQIDEDKMWAFFGDQLNRTLEFFTQLYDVSAKTASKEISCPDNATERTLLDLFQLRHFGALPRAKITHTKHVPSSGNIYKHVRVDQKEVYCMTSVSGRQFIEFTPTTKIVVTQAHVRCGRNARTQNLFTYWSRWNNTGHLSIWH